MYNVQYNVHISAILDSESFNIVGWKKVLISRPPDENRHFSSFLFENQNLKIERLVYPRRKEKKIGVVGLAVTQTNRLLEMCTRTTRYAPSRVTHYIN